MSLLNYSDKAIAFTTLTGWTQVGATAEYYYATDAKHKPLVVTMGGVEMSEGTLTSLAVGEWAWGDPDTIGYDTITCRVTGDADPDTLTMKASLALTLVDVTAAHSVGIMSIEIQSDEASDAKNVKMIRTNDSDVSFFEDTISIPALDTVILDHAIVLAAEEKFKIMSASEVIGIVLNANDIDNS